MAMIDPIHASHSSLHSGIARIEEVPPPVTAESAQAAIRTANQVFERRVGNRLELPITVLVEQRNSALKELVEFREAAEREMQELEDEHERVVSSLMQCHQQELDAFAQGQVHREALVPEPPTDEVTKVALVRDLLQDAAEEEESPTETTLAVHIRLAALEGTIVGLQRDLEAANAEVEETRRDAIRIQLECDEALTASDNDRLAMQTEVEKARDEVIEVQAFLDEALRQLEDARDQAREEQARLAEEIGELRRALENCHRELAKTRPRSGR
jgi:replicative DNA helicase